MEKFQKQNGGDPSNSQTVEMEGVLNSVDDLESLVEPFTNDEIEGIVKHMKSD